MSQVIGLFKRWSDVERALLELNRHGIEQAKTGVLAHSDAELQELIGQKTDRTVTKGTAQGAAVGGLAGLLVGLSTVVIPGIGPLVAAGLAIGAAAGGAAGGAYIGMELTDEEQRFYTQGLREGGILLTVTVDADQVPLAERILREAGAAEMKPRDGG